MGSTTAGSEPSEAKKSRSGANLQRDAVADPRQPLCPLGLSGLVSYQILTDFDIEIRAAFAFILRLISVP